MSKEGTAGSHATRPAARAEDWLGAGRRGHWWWWGASEGHLHPGPTFQASALPSLVPGLLGTLTLENLPGRLLARTASRGGGRGYSGDWGPTALTCSQPKSPSLYGDHLSAPHEAQLLGAATCLHTTSSANTHRASTVHRALSKWEHCPDKAATPWPGRTSWGPLRAHLVCILAPGGEPGHSSPLGPGPLRRRVSCPDTGGALGLSSKRAGAHCQWEISFRPCACRALLWLLPLDSLWLSLTLLWWAWHKQVLS